MSAAVRISFSPPRSMPFAPSWTPPSPCAMSPSQPFWPKVGSSRGLTDGPTCTAFARCGPAALIVSLDSWTLDEVPIDGLGPKRRRRTLTERLAEAVTDRLVSDRAIGLLLSGGIDSTLILSILAASGELERVTCFIGDAGKSSDAAYAHAHHRSRCAGYQVPLAYGPESVADFLPSAYQRSLFR